MLPSGEQIAIAHGDQRAVVTEVGATLRAYVKGGVPVIEGYAGEETPTGARGQVLFPWPNRLGGRWGFSDRAAEPEVNDVEHATSEHGIAAWRPFRVDAVNQNRCVLTLLLHPSPGYPFLTELAVAYHLGKNGLTVTTTVTNRDDVPVPFGLGFHPYLAVTTPTIEGAELEVPARNYVAVDDRMLPTGEILPVAGGAARLHARQVGQRPRARPDLHRAGARRHRAGHGAPARLGRGRGRAERRPQLPLPPGLHRRQPRAGPAPHLGRRRADDLPARRPAQRQGHRRARARPALGRVVAAAPHHAVTDRVVLVTGSTSGIGAATAAAFAAAGDVVVFNSSRSVEAGVALSAATPNSHYVQADVSVPEDCERLLATVRERCGRLDVLVNNAGATQLIPHRDLAAATVDVWRRIFEVNVFGTWQLSVAAMDDLRAARGCVVNVSSLAGVRPSGSSIPYAASKAALNHMTALLAQASWAPRCASTRSPRASSTPRGRPTGTPSRGWSRPPRRSSASASPRTSPRRSSAWSTRPT